MPCIGICHKYKAKKPRSPLSRYGVGQKMCNPCGIFVEWDGIHCPCCGKKMRTRPRNAKRRRLIIEARNVKRI